MFPVYAAEFVGALSLGIAIALCNAAGIGGGGIVVTIGISLMMLSAKESVAMSNVTISFGCIVRYIKTFKNKHPLKDATSIDYGIVTCMLPLVMLGTTIGVQINDILPDTLVYILLFVTLLYLTYNTSMKSIETYRKESQAMKKQREAEEAAKNKKSEEEEEKEDMNISNKSHGSLNRLEQIKGIKESKSEGLEDKELFRPLVNNTKTDSELHYAERGNSERVDSRMSGAIGPEVTADDKDVDDEDKEVLIGSRKSIYREGTMSKVLKDLIASEKSHFRIKSIFAVIIPFITILLITMLRGTRYFRSIIKIERCQPVDILLLVGMFALLISQTIINIILLKREYTVKVENNYQFVKGDVIWNQKTITKFCIFAIVAGFISGAVGLSGGVLFTPLFLEFGIAPTVASATSMYMAMFATMSSSALFMFAGYVVYPI